MIFVLLSLWYPDTLPWKWPLAFELGTTLYLLALVPGYLYHRSDVRKKLMLNPHWNRTDNFICDQLLEMLNGATRARARSLSCRQLRQIYWRFVDNENSLGNRSNVIRWNGVFVSSAADLAIISIAAAILHYGLFFAGFMPNANLIWFLACGTMAIIADYVGVKWLIERHLILQDDQLLLR